MFALLKVRSFRMFDRPPLKLYLHNLIDQLLTETLEPELEKVLAPFEKVLIVNFPDINQTNVDNAFIGPSHSLYIGLLEALLFTVGIHHRHLYGIVLSVCLLVDPLATRLLYVKYLLAPRDSDPAGQLIATDLAELLRALPDAYMSKRDGVTKYDAVHFGQWVDSLKGFVRAHPTSEQYLNAVVFLDAVTGKDTHYTKEAKVRLAKRCPYRQWTTVHLALSELTRQYPMEFFGFSSVWELFEDWLDPEDTDWIGEINVEFIKYIESIYFDPNVHRVI